MAKSSKFDYSHPAYLKAKGEALARDRGMCVFCGESDAEHAHHRALRYPTPEMTTADDLVSLCYVCHDMMTTYRRYRKQGGDRWQWKSALENFTKELLRQCSTKSKSAALGPSSCTTARPDSTQDRLPISRRRKSPASAGSNRTAADDARLQELECQIALWLDSKAAPTIPEAAIRSCIETGARKLKQGPQVREGLIVDAILSFDYDKERYGVTVEELGKTAQFTVPVKVGQSRIARTRAKFDEWEATFRLETDEELVDQEQLARWLDIAGRRIGLGDWRPEKSGTYGRVRDRQD